LGVLIFFHEFCNFLVARLFGVGVEKFSLGFGPRVIGKKVGITDYRISAIPLGGYVKMVGEEPDAQINPEDIPLSFTHKHVAKRMLIVAAGPVFNILLAVIIFFGIFLVSGTFVLKPSVGSVKQGTPAFAAGLEKGDLISAINESAINSWDEMAEIINASKGQTIKLTVRRGESTHNFSLAPEQVTTKNIFGEDVQRYIIGITAAGETYSKEMNVFQAFSESMIQTYRVTELMVVIIVKLISGDISTDTLGGPIMIAQMAGDSAKAGIGSLISFIALISVNLAIINLREIAQQVGLFILILLMILVFYNDISRIFFS
jgi:regulator of sigma E protease